MSKIIVRIVGGLGNQIFIYGFAKALKKKYRVPVLIETRTGFIKDEYKRKYLLNFFLISLAKCSLIDSLYIPLLKRFPLLIKKSFPRNIFLDEKDIGLLENIIKSKKYKKIFISGYFQKESYTQGIIEDLRLELNPNNIKKHDKQIQLITSTNSVAIHFRRTDYEVNGLVSMDYYYGVIEKIATTLSNPYFFVFTDEPNWVKSNFNIKFTWELLHYSELEDFYLMKHCKHFIISNSTFSWWASRLSQHKNKIIFEPEGYLK